MNQITNTPREVYNAAHFNANAMDVSDHPHMDAPTTTTEKEDN